MLDLEEVKQRILRGEEIEKILEEADWKEFEDLITKLLEKHDFKIFKNFKFRTSRKYEIDVLAFRGNLCLAIDCKKWKRGRYKKAGLKQAVEDQVKRVKELKKFMSNNLLFQSNLGLKLKETKFTPLIVTWFEEELLEIDKVLIVPVWKLNDFLLSLSEYI